MKYLCTHKKYADAEAVFQQMMSDPKVRLFFEDNAENPFCNMKLRMDIKRVRAKVLVSTCGIDITKSVDVALKDKAKTAELVQRRGNVGCEFSSPIVTFRENYIIDGHKRCLMTYVMNPSANMISINFDCDGGCRSILKALYKVLPAETISMDIFDDNLTEEDYAKHVSEVIDDEAISFIASHTEIDEDEDFASDKELTVSRITDRIINIKCNNYPEK